jgi:hypothetical protein
MERRIASFVSFGFLFGSIVGVALGTVQNDLPVGAVWMFGATTGGFLGWFVAIAVERRNKAGRP